MSDVDLEIDGAETKNRGTKEDLGALMIYERVVG